MFDLIDKVAVVAGGATGIGGRTAEVFAAAGAKVVVGDLAVDAGRERAAAIRAAGGDALFVPVDVGDPAAVEGLVSAAVEHYGRLDVLHNNAAALHLFRRDVPLADMDVDAWDEIMRINLRGVMLGCRAAIPHMVAGGGGSIINTASSRAFTGTVDSAGYGTSKLAVVGLTRYVATQYGKQGVRCNAIAPGVVVTERAAARMGDAEYAGILRHYLTPRLGTPDDVAACALWLASDAAGFVTGQVINVDGGLGAHQPNFAELSDLAGRG
ncbi:SDR family oxidoreductase [Pseudonocardia sp. NPDC049154]|uniref:SDR family NAD(P)-dependent oxidoreductase n=1 Tax=Pseudonocardia sp. NPDC049154 TaxID=3155501 RepID=UPI0033DF65DF